MPGSLHKKSVRGRGGEQTPRRDGKERLHLIPQATLNSPFTWHPARQLWPRGQPNGIRLVVPQSIQRIQFTYLPALVAGGVAFCHIRVNSEASVKLALVGLGAR
jgi:hypothetical protein